MESTCSADTHLVKHVVSNILLMDGVSDQKKLPESCNIKEATRLRAKKIRMIDNDSITDEICRRERLENPDHEC